MAASPSSRKREGETAPSALALGTLRCSQTKSATSACSGSSSNRCKASFGGPGVRTSSNFLALGALASLAAPWLEPCDDAAPVQLLPWLWPRASKSSSSFSSRLVFFFLFGGAFFSLGDARLDPAQRESTSRKVERAA